MSWIKADDKAPPKDRPLLLIARVAKIPDANPKLIRLVGQWDRHVEQFRPVDVPSLSGSAVPADLIPIYWAELPAFPAEVPEERRS
jgi:hypothetical protein